MLEYEKKIMLTEEEYDAILNAFGNSLETTVQTNYYFDTEDCAMNVKGITCRIRAKNGRFKATIKYHNSGQIECSTEENIYEKSLFDPKPFLDLGLKLHGELVTERTFLWQCDRYKVMLDKNAYLGYTDYELEVEFRPDCDQDAMNFIYGVGRVLAGALLGNDDESFYARIGNGGSKAERFFKCFKNFKK